MSRQKRYTSRMSATLLNTPLVPSASAPPQVTGAGQRLMDSMLDLGRSVVALHLREKDENGKRSSGKTVERRGTGHPGSVSRAFAELVAALEEQQKARF